MGQLLAAWRRYWFTPASLTALGASRIALVGIVLYLNHGDRLLHVALVPAAHWQPVPALAMLGVGQPDVAAVQRLSWVLRTALVAAGVGVLTRGALLLTFGLMVVQEAMLNSFGKVSHATIPLLYALLFFAVAPAGEVFSLGAMWRRMRAAGRSAVLPPPPARTSPYARWPLDLLFFELASFYLLAGLTKLRTSGLKWADGWTLQYFLLVKGTPGGLWLATHFSLCVLFSCMVLVLELGAMAGMVRRLRPYVLAGIVCFHAATTYFMNVSFWPVSVLCILFVPWDRLGRVLVRVSGLAHHRLDVLYDGRCALCRRTLSVIRDLDLGHVTRPVDIAVGHSPEAVHRCEGVRVLDGHGCSSGGFDACRRLAWLLPAAWPLLPLLYVPGVMPVGRRAYAWVAARQRARTSALHVPTP